MRQCTKQVLLDSPLHRDSLERSTRSGWLFQSFLIDLNTKTIVLMWCKNFISLKSVFQCCRPKTSIMALCINFISLIIMIWHINDSWWWCIRTSKAGSTFQWNVNTHQSKSVSLLSSQTCSSIKLLSCLFTSILYFTAFSLSHHVSQHVWCWWWEVNSCLCLCQLHPHCEINISEKSLG